MDSSISLKVDLANPEIIEEKLPEAEAALARLQEEFAQKKDELAHWHNLVVWMQAMVRAASGEPAVVPSSQPNQHLTELQAMVVEVVNREMRKIRAKDVTAILQSEGHRIPGDTVSNTLWYVAEKVSPPPIRRAGRGFYAPLAYENDEATPGEAVAGLVAGIGAGALAAGAVNSLLKAGGS